MDGKMNKLQFNNHKYCSLYNNNIIYVYSHY